jgi:mannitol 2-dehydrogenase
MVALKKESMGAVALNNQNLPALAAYVTKPKFDRAKTKTSIVHIGVGGFHRAHQALYTQEILERDGGDWGICGIGILPQDAKMRDALNAQDFLYTLVEKKDDGANVKVIGSITEFLLLQDAPQKVLAKLADAQTKIVSLTVTEKGYCLDANKELDFNHPAVAHDLANLNQPQTAVGLLVCALQQRMQKSLPSFTVLSCDNLPTNGAVTRGAVLSFAKKVDAGLARWIETNTTFPNTMVDRITPVTAPADISNLEVQHGIADAWPVVCETFRQWIVEDNFTMGRPAWEKVGVQFVSDVHAYELMKIRLLNGTHSSLAHPGILLGLKYVHEATSHPAIQAFVRRIMTDEITPQLPPVPGIDLASYQQTIIDRFASPVIQDGLPRIIMDGSQKLPNGILAPIQDCIAKNKSYAGLALSIALWIRHLRGKDEVGNSFAIVDPRSMQLQALANATPDDPMPILQLADIFGADLPKNAGFVTAVTKQLQAINRQGVLKTLQDYIQ